LTATLIESPSVRHAPTSMILDDHEIDDNWRQDVE